MAGLSSSTNLSNSPDNNLNLFKHSLDGAIEQISNVIEHHSRLDEISTECQFFIDENMYKALGNAGVPFKFTKIFVESPQKFSPQKR